MAQVSILYIEIDMLILISTRDAFWVPAEWNFVLRCRLCPNDSTINNGTENPYDREDSFFPQCDQSGAEMVYIKLFMYLILWQAAISPLIQKKAQRTDPPSFYYLFSKALAG